MEGDSKTEEEAYECDDGGQAGDSSDGGKCREKEMKIYATLWELQNED